MKKTVDVKFNEAGDFEPQSRARWTSKNYAYYVTDEQARRIIDEKIEYAVVQAPSSTGALKVVKIVGEPSDTPEKATRRIVDVVDFAEYEATEKKIAEAKRIKAEIKRLADEAAERARLQALANGDPAIAELLKRLEDLGV